MTKKQSDPKDGKSELSSLLSEIFADPDVEKAVSKVAGRVFARVGAALANPAPASSATTLPPEVIAAYGTLGLMPSVDDEVLEACYRALAKKHHPDAGGDPQRMVAVNKAHDAILAYRRKDKA